jgi:hypothetical protein
MIGLAGQRSFVTGVSVRGGCDGRLCNYGPGRETFTCFPDGLGTACFGC